jgi:hypothetical protein
VKIARVVSGGQTGADRAPLDAAIALGFEYGGWCPRGGWAEDFRRPPGLLSAYPCLRETPTREASVRTTRNVRDSHATLILRVEGADSPGTELTAETVRSLDRPLFLTEVGRADLVLGWLSTLGEELTLNVAGPRESEAPGLYSDARRTLMDVLGCG